MTYTVTCPDPECDVTFTVEKTPEELADPDDLTTCLECRGEWESEYDEQTQELTLIDPEAEDEMCDLCGCPIDDCECDDDSDPDDDPEEDE